MQFENAQNYKKKFHAMQSSKQNSIKKDIKTLGSIYFDL